MSRFYVGQRVRIIGCLNAKMKHHIGKEGVIAGASPCHNGFWVVDSAATASNGLPCGWHHTRLEPILDPGLEACDKDFKCDLDKLLERQGVSV